MAHIGQELRLMLACLFKLPALVLDFVEQAHVLNRNHSLVYEGCNEIDLLFRERVDRRPRQEYAANRPPLAESGTPSAVRKPPSFGVSRNVNSGSTKTS